MSLSDESLSIVLSTEESKRMSRLLWILIAKAGKNGLPSNPHAA